MHIDWSRSTDICTAYMFKYPVEYNESNNDLEEIYFRKCSG